MQPGPTIKRPSPPSYLLPQAYPEGAPLHSSYPGGNASNSGVCVTLLKAFFDESWVIPNPVQPDPSDPSKLIPYVGPPLTVGGELNKIALNSGLGRNWAGIHWRTDAGAAFAAGEAIAIAILRNERQAYREPSRASPSPSSTARRSPSDSQVLLRSVVCRRAAKAQAARPLLQRGTARGARQRISVFHTGQTNVSPSGVDGRRTRRRRRTTRRSDDRRPCSATMKIQGTVVAVTGAASGLGRSLAQVLAQRGAQVAISDVDEAGLRETEALIRTERPDARVSAHVVDVREQSRMEQYARDVEAQHGGCDILINNAGIAIRADFEHISYEQLRFVIDVNLWGVIHGIKAFLPLLRKRPEAHIVNIGSVNALVTFPQNSAYNMSKFAVLALSDTLVQELAGDTIHITCVHPGAIKTNLVRNSPGFTEAQVAYFDTVAKTTGHTAAHAIVRAIEKNKQQLLIGKDAWFMAIGKRLFPSWFVRFVGSHTNQPQKPLLAPDTSRTE
jgi:NAD(P)-dependent dehydrogenase (short-subunit alcohol dehydrogenase family)